MKKFLFLLLAVSLFACKNVEQYKAGIEELGTKWDSTSKMVEEFSTMLNGSIGAQNAGFDSLKIDDAFMAKLKGADLDKVKMGIEAYKAAGAPLSDIAGKLSELKTSWEGKAGEVAALKDGLAAGKLEGDVTAKIAELTNFITSNETQLNTWKETITKASEGSTSALTALQTVVGPYMAKK